MTPEEFLQTFGSACQAAMRKNGGFASVRLAQIALESGWGKYTPKDHQTGQESYNLTGVKGKGPAGSVRSWTQEWVDGQYVDELSDFRAYHSFEEHIIERDRIFVGWPENYGGYLNARTPADACRALQNAPNPYATDPEYADKLIGMIERYGFATADVLAPQDTGSHLASYAAAGATTDLDWESVAPPDNAPWERYRAPIRSDAGHRSCDLLEAVIKQFHVATAKRYHWEERSYGNIFVWDVTVALGAEVPHWVAGADQQPAAPGGGARELNANAVVAWLRRRGPRYGWRPADAARALEYANEGKPAIAAWRNPDDAGQVAIVRPGTADPSRGVPIAQAGHMSSDDCCVADRFDRVSEVLYFVHE